MKKKLLIVLFIFCFSLSLTACTESASPSMTSSVSPENNREHTGVEQTEPILPNHAEKEALDETKEMQMNVTIGEKTFVANLRDNSSAEALTALLKNGPLTIDMHDYGNFEKVGPIGQTLPRNDERITTGPGDLILYQGNQLVLYYATNTWDFTAIGHIPDVTTEELLAVLGAEDVTVQFSLKDD